MSSQQATVEVLTAEVRVLMVGSRQVTLSVARQLDEVEPDEITPFGRIQTGKRLGDFYAAAAFVEVIGSAEGVLARSTAIRERRRCKRGSQGEPGMSAGGVGYVRWQCHVGAALGPLAADKGHEDHFWLADLDAEYPEWIKLPLIVLAGLR